MKCFGLVGWSGSGKTTLMHRLLPELIGRGYRVSTMKHTHHDFDIDKPGKDSYMHREAGAHEVLITGGKRFALLHENRSEPEPSIESLLARMEEVDLVLIEGFKSHPHAKLEVHRAMVGKPLLANEDPSVVAVASPDPLALTTAKLLDLGDVPAIADFIVDFCDLPRRRHDGAA
ncbi:MAG: molybdopterin-guanine dinucleotide biosynthesis protein B [Rhodospirillaceae bacterium]